MDSEDKPEIFDDSELISLAKLTKDLKDASKKLSKREVRYLVDVYY